jgi:hypothetical protein
MKSATRKIFHPTIDATSLVAVRPSSQELGVLRVDNAIRALAGRRAR